MALRAVTSNGVAITPSSLTVSGTLTGSSGTATAASISPTINQSGTAGYTAFDINPTESATGSGTKLLQRWAVGGSEKGRVGNDGGIAGLFLSTTGNIGFSTSFGSANDVTLFRNAADILALRRSTNAQTFRVYNTHTDASNGEWLALSAGTAVGGNGFRFGTYANGTGGTRNLGFVVSGTVRWGINTSGHFLAEADNSYDIGASGANRPRNVYIGGSTVIGAFHTVGVSTVATLPAAAGAARAQIFVSDSSVAAAGNFGAIVAGGGANIVPVYSDGTNWRIG